MSDLRRNLTEPAPLRWAITAVVLIFLTLFLIIPLATVFISALAKGTEAYWSAVLEPDAICAPPRSSPQRSRFRSIWCSASVRMGVRSSTSRANLLTTLIDMPFAVSPVISGMLFILLFGRNGVFGSWLFDRHSGRVRRPGIVLATTTCRFRLSPARSFR